MTAGLDGCWTLAEASFTLVKRVLGLSRALRFAFSSLPWLHSLGRFPGFTERVPAGVRFSLSTTSTPAMAPLSCATPANLNLKSPQGYHTSLPDAVTWWTYTSDTARRQNSDPKSSCCHAALHGSKTSPTALWQTIGGSHGAAGGLI